MLAAVIISVWASFLHWEDIYATINYCDVIYL